MRAVAPRIAGVLGGMGPLAAVDFLRKVIELTSAVRDQDHVPLVVHQVPQIPDRSRSILADDDAPLLPMLTGLRRLARAGAEFAVIPCNSAHHWYEDLVRLQGLEILHICDTVWADLERRGLAGGSLSLLGTRGTAQSGFYRSRLAPYGARLVPIDATIQDVVDQAILAVKAGEYSHAHRAAAEAVRLSRSGGADTVILACTELPLALEGDPVLQWCVDSTLALARACATRSLSCQPP